jgi:CHAD domain-containing protein
VAYRIAPDEGVRQAARRCAREQLDNAVGQLLTEIEHDPVEAVHEARKAIKKDRALLRLLRGAMPSEQRAGENAALRETARRLSAARDGAVLIGTVDRLADTFAGQVPKRTFHAVRDKLDPERQGETEIVPSAEAARALAAARARIDDWQLSCGGWQALSPGLSQTYRRGRKALRRVHEEPSLENLHEWRKRVKDLWYDLRLLQPVCGPVVRKKVKEADQLADLLGDDHDLGVLGDTINTISGDLVVDVDALGALIAHRRDELQAQAIVIGDRLYAERTKAFRRRLHRYWRAGKRAAQGSREMPTALITPASSRYQPAMITSSSS